MSFCINAKTLIPQKYFFETPNQIIFSKKCEINK